MFWVKVREHWNTQPGRPVVSFAAVFRDVTQRSSERGMLRDILKGGCKGNYLCPGKCYLVGYLPGICNPALCVLNKVDLQSQMFKDQITLSGGQVSIQ